MNAALIVASGRTKDKENFKPGKKIGTITAIERVALVFHQAGIRQIVVVCEEDVQVKKMVSNMNLTYLPCAANSEMFDNIKTGLSYLADKCQQALITYVDIPLFSVNTVQTLMASEGQVCIPRHHGRCGHPLLLKAEYFGKILDYNGDFGLRGAIEAVGLERQIVDIEDRGVLLDIQRDSADPSLLEEHDAAKLRVSYQVGIGKERIFYDSDMHQLLRLTEELGSLSKACVYMGISLNKGRTLIAGMEQQLEQPVLQTQQGGKSGGYSRLTAEAKHMMTCYDAFCKEADGVLTDLFQKHFKSMIEA